MPAEIAWYEAAALGPFSYLWETERRTHDRGVTFCASTYRAMMRYGWVKEVAA